MSHRTLPRRAGVAESHDTLGDGSRDIERPWDRTWREHTGGVVFSQFFDKHCVPPCTYWLDKHLLGTCHVQALCQALSGIRDGPCPSGACHLRKVHMQEQEQAGQEADEGQMEEMWKVVQQP